MRVILKQDVDNLGNAGEIVSVRPGYGRNFLLARGLAILASAGSVAELEHQKRMADAIRRKQLQAAQDLATRIEGTAVSIRREAGEDDKLFGSVTNRDIAEALAAEGIAVDRKQIQLDDAIRSIGIFTVHVKLHAKVQAPLKVYVIKG
jgi:large subunit ribosomal protein L9